jgi:hypothetical protein
MKVTDEEIAKIKSVGDAVDYRARRKLGRIGKDLTMTTDNWSRDCAKNGSVLCSWWMRLLVLGLAVSAVSVFVVTPSLTRPLAVHLQYSPALGPLLSVADVAAENQISGKVEFALVSILILLPIVRFRLGTVIASLCGFLAWAFLGIIGAGIGA